MPRNAPMRLALFAALSIGLPAAARAPAFCTPYQVPPATCTAEKALPCTGACPKDGSNGFEKWADYWNICLAAKQKAHPGFSQAQFTCNSDDKNMQTLYYTATREWICCPRSPYDDKNQPGGAPPADAPPADAPKTQP